MKFLYAILLTMLAVACGSPENKMIKNIRQLEENKSLSTSDTLINMYIGFADKFPQHEKSVGYLFKAASKSMMSQKGLQGVKLYERIATEYKNDTLAPEALICAGIGYAGMKDPTNAKRLYDRFLEVYPNHPRIDEVKMWSETAFMSEEELQNRFLERLRSMDSTHIQ
jgi:outer membrane protein assembly factor BamD (BamD/ComL family)